MPRKDIDYSKTIIYKIVCNDLNVKDSYVGSTTDFTKRKNEHKTRCNNPNNPKHNFKIYKTIRDNGGWGNWSMIEIEKYPCNDKNEAHARERYFIESLDSNLNIYIPTRTHKEYVEQHKEKIKTYHQEYHQLNRNKIIEKVRKYAENNKEKIKENQKEYRRLNKEKLSEHNKEYYELNRDKLLKHKREYSKQKIFCPNCKYEFRIDGKSKHERSITHQKNLQNNEDDETITA